MPNPVTFLTLGRWLSRDPIGIAGGFNLYVMAHNDLLNNFDRLGEECYDTENEAAQAAERDGIDQMHASPKGARGYVPEFCGRICKKKKKCKTEAECFYYTGPVRGIFTEEEYQKEEALWKGKPGDPKRMAGGCSAERHPETACNGDDEFVAHWHTHPNSGGPSPGDIQIAIDKNRAEYVGTYNYFGRDTVDRIDPSTGKSTRQKIPDSQKKMKSRIGLLMLLFGLCIAASLLGCSSQLQDHRPLVSPLENELSNGEKRVNIGGILVNSPDYVLVWITNLERNPDLLGYLIVDSPNLAYVFTPYSRTRRSVTVRKPNLWERVNREMDDDDIWTIPDSKDVPGSPWIGDGNWVVLEMSKGGKARRVVYNTPALGSSKYHQRILTFVQFVQKVVHDDQD